MPTITVAAVEPQDRDDRAKAYSWPAYLAIAQEAAGAGTAVPGCREGFAGAWPRRCRMPAGAGMVRA